MKSDPVLDRKLGGHSYSVNCINWHPFKSLILSSTLDPQDTIKLWDPHSQILVHENNLHNNVAITRTQFHPRGNTYFSIGKDHLVYEYEIRYKGSLNRFKLDH